MSHPTGDALARMSNERRSSHGFDLAPPQKEQFEALAAELNEEERTVLLEHGTEAPFCGVFPWR